MKAVVVFESHWGNTAAIARAIAEGIGPGAAAMSTAQATLDALTGAELVVAGAPLLGFRLPTDKMLEGIAASAHKDPTTPDLSHPSMRTWLEGLPPGNGGAAAFETRIWWSPGSAAKSILRDLEAHGYRALADPARFVVKGKYGPLRDGELDRARAWGIELARLAPGSGSDAESAGRDGTRILVEDEGDHRVLRPVTEAMVAQVRGSLKGNGALRGLMDERARDAENDA